MAIARERGLDWDRQPQQASGVKPYWRNRGLNSCLVGSGTLNLTDALAGKPLAPTVSTNLSPSVAPAGRAIFGSTNAGSAGYYLPKASFGQNFTLLVFGGNFTGTSLVSGLIDNDRSATTTGQRHWQFRINANAVDFIRFDTVPNPYFATTAAISASDFTKPGVYVARSAGADMKVWAPGVAPATGTILNTPSTHNSNETDYLLRGIRFDLTQYFPVGDIYLAATFDSALTDAEINSLIANPWQIFEPEEVDRWFSAGGAVSLVLADVAHGHTVEAVTLTQVHSIALADIAHAHALDSVVLNVDATLAVANITHGHTVDAVSLTQTHNLTQADVAHGHAVDAVSLTQTHNLVQADVSHAHVVEAVTLVVGGVTLSLDIVLHAHTLDSINLTQTHSLSLADVAHGHTVEVLTLGQTYNLALADVTHAHTLPNVTFSSVTLSSADLDAIATAVWAKALEGLKAEEMMRIMLAALSGKREGLGTATEKYMGTDGVTPRITLTPDANGNGAPILNGAP